MEDDKTKAKFDYGILNGINVNTNNLLVEASYGSYVNTTHKQDISIMSDISCLNDVIEKNTSELISLRYDYNKLADDHYELKYNFETLASRVLSLESKYDELKAENKIFSDENELLKRKIQYCKQNGIWAEEQNNY